MADQEGWVAQARKPSLDAMAGWTARARGHGLVPERSLTSQTTVASPRFLRPQPDAAEKRRQRSGTPFNSCSPASLNARPEPATRSFTVWETRTSDGPAVEATRAPMETEIPVHLPSTISHSPVCTPARTSMPSSWTR